MATNELGRYDAFKDFMGYLSDLPGGCLKGDRDISDLRGLTRMVNIAQKMGH